MPCYSLDHGLKFWHHPILESLFCSYAVPAVDDEILSYTVLSSGSLKEAGGGGSPSPSHII